MAATSSGGGADLAVVSVNTLQDFTEMLAHVDEHMVAKKMQTASEAPPPLGFCLDLLVGFPFGPI